MALNATHFEYADQGETSVYKFTVGDDPTLHVWFEYADGGGSLHTTPQPGPYHAEEPLGNAAFQDLEALLAARGTTKEQWVKDLMAQYGEYLAWRYGAQRGSPRP
ncbi:MAG: hypothetical protein ACYTEZ_03460 [Planctomycetota bacterium]|jgi:hypothetical protein